MGEIVAFQSSAKHGRRAPPPQGDAQILFFLGVRYMAMEEMPQEEPVAQADSAPDEHGNGPSAGKKRKRRARA